MVGVRVKIATWARVKPSGALEMQGCVCHHPWTLALRASAAPAREVA